MFGSNRKTSASRKKFARENKNRYVGSFVRMKCSFVLYHVIIVMLKLLSELYHDGTQYIFTRT